MVRPSLPWLGFERVRRADNDVVRVEASPEVAHEISEGRGEVRRVVVDHEVDGLEEDGQHGVVALLVEDVLRRDDLVEDTAKRIRGRGVLRKTGDEEMGTGSKDIWEEPK